MGLALLAVVLAGCGGAPGMFTDSGEKGEGSVACGLLPKEAVINYLSGASVEGGDSGGVPAPGYSSCKYTADGGGVAELSMVAGQFAQQQGGASQYVLQLIAQTGSSSTTRDQALGTPGVSAVDVGNGGFYGAEGKGFPPRVFWSQGTYGYFLYFPIGTPQQAVLDRAQQISGAGPR